MKTGVVCAFLSCTIGVAAAQAAETTTFEYDAQGRLTESTKTGGPAGGTIKATSYDRAGNRTNQSVTGAGSALMSGGSIGALAMSESTAPEQEPGDGTEILPDPPTSEGAPFVGEAAPPEVEPVQGEIPAGEEG